MSAKEWAEIVLEASRQYVHGGALDEETTRYEKAAFVAGATFGLMQTGIVDNVGLCNELAHRCGKL